ncbi:MAG: HD domain-containing protein [Desulfurella sp.]|uniref:Ppx/GppA phosphatase family protein n=1 Tax=Desulfurella sp. TaxID=1962857 RepID=UPI003D103095
MPDYPIIAIIDIGSNSIRLQVAQSLEKSYRIIQDYREILRLGDCVFSKGYIDGQTADLFYKNMEVINNLIQNHKATIIRAVGTAALRDAQNAYEIVKTTKERFGIDIEIISGKEEAYYNFLAVLYNFDIKNMNALTIDIGGGSSEIVISQKGELVDSYSTLLGCTRLKHEFLKKDPPSQSSIYAMKDFIEETLQNLDDINIDTIVATGGTLNNIAIMYYMSQNKKATSYAKYVPRSYVKSLINTLRRMKIDDIKKIKGVEEKRADIILPACMVIESIMNFYNVEGFYTFMGGLRTGLLIDTLNKIGLSFPFQTLDSDLKFSRLIELGNKFNFEEPHALCVNNLAKKLFEQLKQTLNLQDKDFALLEAACILHDIGTYISFSKHHMHSYYLITNSDLTGFSIKQKNMIATIAYFHRGSLPNKSHKFYQSFSKKKKDKIKKLAAILRIADGLDRSHRSFVKDIKVSIEKDNIKIVAISSEDTFLEMKAANAKKNLLEKVTGKKVSII